MWIPEWTAIRSPNINANGCAKPTGIVIHYTAAGSAKATANYFATRDSKVSAHTVIGRDGVIFQCVGLRDRAWHAGPSAWGGRKDCNSFMLGIEIANWGLLQKRGDKFFTYLKKDPKSDPWTMPYVGPEPVAAAYAGGSPTQYWEPYPEVQIQAVISCIRTMMAQHPTIVLANIVGHNDVAPERKVDPGPHFPWQRVRSALVAAKVVEHEDPPAVAKALANSENDAQDLSEHYDQDAEMCLVDPKKD